MGMIVSTVLPSLVPRHIDDCYAIHFLHWEFFDLRLSSHQNFPLWTRLYQHVFCRKSSLFSSSSRHRNLGPSEYACRHYAYPNPVPLLLATPLLNHEKNLKCFGIHAQGFPMALMDYVHPPKSLWTPAANPAFHVIDRFVLLRVLHFYLCFWFLLVQASGFPGAPHSYFPLLSGTGFSVYLLTSNTESCDGDDEEVGVGVVEELVDKPGTTNGTYCNQFSCHFWWDVVFDRWSSGKYTHDPRRAFRKRELREFLQEASPSRLRTILWLFCCFFSCLVSLLLTICLQAPDSTRNSLFSGSFVDAARSTHSSAGE